MLEIKYVPITSLKCNPDNPRVHSAKQIRQIARSIEAFQCNVPLLVDRRALVRKIHLNRDPGDRTPMPIVRVR